MKTFLWTTLFWILAAIAWLLCLGFGNLWTQVLDNTWMVKFLPRNVQVQLCDPLVASAVKDIDWCASAENMGCWCQSVEQENVSEESLNIQELVDSLNVLSANQETIYNQMNESFSVVLQNLSTLAEMYYNNPTNNIAESQWEPIVDEREQQRLELQAQIEALQYQMENL